MKLKETVEMVSSEGEHWYKTESGMWVPSVTTILNCYPKGIGFQMYLANQESWESSRDVLDQAGKRGTRIHKATEDLEDGVILRRMDWELDEWKMLMAFVDWYTTYKPKLLQKEFSVTSEQLGTGGTIDRLYEIDGDVVLLDIKTSKKIHDSYWSQVAAYAYMYLQKNPDKNIENVAVLRLGAKSKLGYEYKTKHLTETLDDLLNFNACKQLWDSTVGKTGPTEVTVPLELKLDVTHGTKPKHKKPRKTKLVD